MLMDLMHDERVTVIDGVVVAGPDTADPLSDAILARIRRMPIPQGIGYWINALGAPQFRAQDRITWRLIERGLVSIDVRLALVVFASTRYIVTEPAVRDAIASRITRALTSDDRVEPQTVSLITMADACGILKHVIKRQYRRAAWRRARSIMQSDEFASDAALATAQYAYAASLEVYASVCAAGHGTGGGHGGGHGGH
jgi:hypothetical protein